MISTAVINSIFALTLSTLLAAVETKAALFPAQTSDCYWVVRSWQKMGKNIPANVSSTDNSCCTLPMTGVTCDTSNRVKGIDWSFEDLTGSIPSEIGNLKSLTWL